MTKNIVNLQQRSKGKAYTTAVPFATFSVWAEAKGERNCVQQSIGFKGAQLEYVSHQLLASYESFTVKQMDMEMDVYFGADMQVSYKKEEKNYSFFLDVTSRHKKHMKYLKLDGSYTEKHEEAFSIQLGKTTLYIGVKYRHSSFFFYKKPVLVLVFDNYNGQVFHDITGLDGLIIAAHEAILDQTGGGARASKMVYPNMNFYGEEVFAFIKDKQTQED